METVTENSWHLQKGVPIALILAIAIQTAGGVWFISALNSTVTEAVERNKVQDVRIDRSRVMRRPSRSAPPPSRNNSPGCGPAWTS